MARDKTKLKSPVLYTIGWITALPIERAAARALLHEEHDEPENFHQHQSDTNSYTWGRIGQHNIVIASLSAGVYGIVSAATTASELVHSLPHVRIGLLVGIGGGIARPDLDQDVRLGDVVVSEPGGVNGGVVQYDLGKAGSRSELKGSLDKPPPVLLKALSALKAEHEMRSHKIQELLEAMLEANPGMKRPKSDFTYQGVENDRLFQPHYSHMGGKTCAKCDVSQQVVRLQRASVEPEIHYGVIASGNTLFKDAAARDSLLEDLELEECLCVEMEAAGLMDRFPCLVIRGICDYADSHKNDRWQRYAAATAAAFAVELLEYVPVKNLEETPQVTQVLKSLRQKVNTLSNAIERLDDSFIFDQLPIAEGAWFNSHVEEHNPVCLSNTRVELLNDINEWIESPSSKNIFWLNGMAGTGKSTISRTVCQLQSKTDNLVASFFFQRGETDRGNLAKLVPTLARQLASSLRVMVSSIKDTLSANPFITRSPDSPGLPPGPTSLVIVIDALDECENEADIRELLKLFSGTMVPRRLHLRVFITSRPELAVQLGFSEIDGTYQDVILHRIPQLTVEHDIEVFLRHEFDLIRTDFNRLAVDEEKLSEDWPGQYNLVTLVTKTTPLFIAAATICRFVRDFALGSPDELFNRVLDSISKTYASELDLTYSPILEQQIMNKSRRRKEEVIQDFRFIVGTIITLASPLSVNGLASLLGVTFNRVLARLRALHSVIDVPNSLNLPIRMMHLSFRDYLTDIDQKDITQFWVDEKEIHRSLAQQCLNIMSKALRENMCGLLFPGVARSEVDRLDIEKCIPPELQYACRHWVHHQTFAACEQDDRRQDDRRQVEWEPVVCQEPGCQQIYHVLTKHLLHWVEVMALLGALTDCVDMLFSLVGWLKSFQHQKIVKSGSGPRRQGSARRYFKGTKIMFIGSRPQTTPS
ncbi:hypothetical protein ACHAPJ_012159 [Fusarium lateritium]